MSIPCGFDGKGLPIGLQIQGNAFAEAQILERRASLPAGDRLASAHPAGLRAMNRAMKWEVVIGLETHTQLSTASKIFSGASTAFGAAPNTPGVRGRYRAARRPAGVEQGCGRARDPISAWRSAARSTGAASSRARITSTPTCRRAIRSSQYEIPVVQGGSIAIVSPTRGAIRQSR